MSKKTFEVCSGIANNNLNNKGNLSEFLKAYLNLAKEMGKEEIAYEAISEIPPSEALVNKDPKVDIIVSMCEQSLMNVRQNIVEEPMVGLSR